MNNNILATFVTYKNLYNDKNTDVYDIIGEFARYVILAEHKPSYQQALFPTLIEKYFDFNIPTLVLKPAIKRLDGVTLENREYKIDYNLLQNHTDFQTLQNLSIKKTEQIISDLILFLCDKIPNFEVTSSTTDSIMEAFRRYILDESSNGEYDPYISAFILEKSTNIEYTNNINQIREGHILYNGLCQNDEVFSHGLKDELTIYLDTEIIFHLAGYNGTTFQQLASEFLDLVSVANQQSTLIKLRFFEDTKLEIEKFFSTAEKLFTNNTVIKPGETAMISILKDCKSTIDITNKCSSLFYMLGKKHITLESKNDFYHSKYTAYNLESSEYAGTPDEKNIRLLSHINKLRGNTIVSDYAKTKAILISETSSVLEHSRMFTQEKVANYGDRNKSITSLAVNLYTITNILWYKLNRSLRGNSIPSTIDSVIRAQIVLSKYINESITDEYDKLMEQYKNGLIEKEELAVLILGMRRHSSKPELIIKEGVDDALALICEKDINKFKEDFELSNYAHEELKIEHENTLKQLVSVKREVDYWKIQSFIQQKQGMLMSEQTKLDNLKEWKEKYAQEFSTQAEQLERSIKLKTILLVTSYIAYYSLVVILILFLGWNTMEPITYILGIPPIVALFVSQKTNLNFSFDTWIHAYEKSSKYMLAKSKLDEFNEKVIQQQNIVDNLKHELSQ